MGFKWTPGVYDTFPLKKTQHLYFSSLPNAATCDHIYFKFDHYRIWYEFYTHAWHEQPTTVVYYRVKSGDGHLVKVNPFSTWTDATGMSNPLVLNNGPLLQNLNL